MSKTPVPLLTAREKEKIVEIATLLEKSPEPDRGLNLRIFLRSKKITSREIQELQYTCTKLFRIKKGTYTVQKWMIPIALLVVYILLSIFMVLTWKTFIVYVALLVVALVMQFRLWLENKDILHTITWISRQLHEFHKELVVSKEND